MSGGAYNFAYFDAEELGRTVRDMAEDVDDNDEIPDEVEERLSDISEQLLDNSELLRAVEWYRSGDISSESVEETLEEVQ